MVQLFGFQQVGIAANTFCFIQKSLTLYSTHVNSNLPENFFTFSLLFGAFSWAHHKLKLFLLTPTFLQFIGIPARGKRWKQTPISVPCSGCLVYEYETAGRREINLSAIFVTLEKFRHALSTNIETEFCPEFPPARMGLEILYCKMNWINTYQHS